MNNTHLLFRSLPIWTLMAVPWSTCPAIAPVTDPCDSTLQVTLSISVLSGYLVDIQAQIDTGYYSVQGYTWNFGDGQFAYSSAPQIVHPYPGAGNYLLCLTIWAVGAGQSQCQRTTCLPVQLAPNNGPPFPCDSLYLDFTATYANGAFQFDLLDPGALMYGSLSWDLGDGSTASLPTVMHTYSGTGPFEVCLSATVFTGSDSCAQHVCHWLYSGPDSIPCSQVVTPSFDWAAQEGFVAFFNTSGTSGSPYSLFWDLGDGATSTQEVFLHEFAFPGSYQVCLHLVSWGTLVPDSCEMTACQVIELGMASGLAENAPGAFRAFPSPFSDHLNVELPPGNIGGRLLIIDPSGRVISERVVKEERLLGLDLAFLNPGMYFLRLEGPSRVLTERIIRQ
ncbi:MAG: T9SS type A sorting domain-containing protein [Flavobacteriales bacterium]|nr:T9SS type A sorting domain-containing protein [Flavobacteriales bacterium]MCB9167060.1 T9SS type A sorting domain-containing protein [Flavobacteriales bacterium]